MEEYDLRNVCRTCLSEEGEFYSMFVAEDISGQSLQLSEMLTSCTSVKVAPGDGLPGQVCTSCATTTVNMYLFKLKCEKSDEALREKLRKMTVYYEDLEEHERTDRDVEVVKPEVVVEQEGQEAKVTENEIVLDELDTFDFDYKSDSEDFPEIDRHEEVDHANSETTKQSCKVKEFECDICQKLFSRQDLLIRHKIAHAMKMGEETFQNEHCKIDERDQNKLLVIKTEEFMFSCAECDVLFIHKLDLDNHIAQEHEKKEAVVNCEICSKKFSKVSHLNRHLKVHTSGKSYKCRLCNKGFARQEQLNHHMNLHTGIKPHVCDICFKGFNQISNLKDHMRTHNGEKPFLCSTCGKGFNQLGNLRQHTIRHSGIKAHLCSTCGNGFASKGELSAHLRKHTGARPFVCPVCGRGFTTSSSLTKHKRIHSGEKPYECDVCKMKFSRSGILARHKRTHTGEKPYVCKFCSKAFSQSNDLTSHLRIHTGEKPFICDQCGQAFRQSSALKTHKKTHIDKSNIMDSKPIIVGNLVSSNFLSTYS